MAKLSDEIKFGKRESFVVLLVKKITFSKVCPTRHRRKGKMAT